MNRIYVALALALTIIILCAIQFIYITTTAGVCLRLVEDAEKKMENNEVMDAAEEIARLDTRLNHSANAFAIFLHHSSIISLTEDVGTLKAYAKAGEKSDFFASSARVKKALKAIIEIELPLPGNIF